MGQQETVQIWDPLDFVTPNTDTPELGEHTVFIEQISNTTLLDEFTESFSGDAQKAQTLKGILELSEQQTNLCNQTRIRLKVNENGEICIIGMDWIGFVDGIFFVSPAVFLDDTSPDQRNPFRAQGLKLPLATKPTNMIFASSQTLTSEKDFIDAMSLEEMPFSNEATPLEIETHFGKGTKYYLPKALPN